MQKEIIELRHVIIVAISTTVIINVVIITFFNVILSWLLPSSLLSSPSPLSSSLSSTSLAQDQNFPRLDRSVSKCCQKPDAYTRSCCFNLHRFFFFESCFFFFALFCFNSKYQPIALPIYPKLCCFNLQHWFIWNVFFFGFNYHSTAVNIINFEAPYQVALLMNLQSVQSDKKWKQNLLLLELKIIKLLRRKTRTSFCRDGGTLQ